MDNNTRVRNVFAVTLIVFTGIDAIIHVIIGLYLNVWQNSISDSEWSSVYASAILLDFLCIIAAILLWRKLAGAWWYAGIIFHLRYLGALSFYCWRIFPIPGNDQSCDGTIFFILIPIIVYYLLSYNILLRLFISAMHTNRQIPLPKESP